MTFATYETSIAAGKPVLLYEFQRQATYWRYTSAEIDIAVGTTIYAHIDGLQDDGISQSGDASRDQLSITAPLSLPAVQSYLTSRPSTRTRVVIRSLHRGDTDAPVQWVGYINSVRRGALGQCTIACESIASTFARPGVRLAFSRSCPYTVYDRQCGVSPEKFMVPGTVQSLDGQSITALALGAQGDGYFTGGFLAFTSTDGFAETRGIDLQTGTTAVIYGGTAGMAADMAVKLYPGDDYTIATCRDRFGNQLNNGAFPGMPGKSPFDGSEAF